MVVHGPGVADLASNVFYGQQNSGAANANAAIVEALTQQGVKLYVCGQSAAYYGLDKSALLPGVDMALSAMTAHAILAQDGFSTNPF